MFEGLKNKMLQRRIEKEKRTFLENHKASADVTEMDEEAWHRAFGKDVFEKALGRMRTHFGRIVGGYVERNPQHTVSEICRLVFNEHPTEIRMGMGDPLPENVHRVVQTHVENTLVAELVTSIKIGILLKTRK